VTDAWRTSPYHRAGSALAFPVDEGWHHFLRGPSEGERTSTWPGPDRMEWVYLNSHVQEVGGEGRSFVVFAAYFSQHLRFLVVRAWDREERYLGAWTGSALGTMRAMARRFDVSFTHPAGEDRWYAIGQDFSSRLEATDDAGQFAVTLDLANQKVPYEAGGIGYLPFADSGWFSYYSLTRLAVHGTLRFGAEFVTVEGLGWFDHQWGDFFVTPFRNRVLEEYEWMSIQLDSGDELMLTTVWNPDDSSPSVEAFGGAGLITRGGRFERIIGNRGFTRTRFWRSLAQDAIYSAGWRFRAEEWDTDLVITPRHPDQLTPIVDAARPLWAQAVAAVSGGLINRLGSFWEGSCRVTGRCLGQSVTGVAFAELIKRYEHPEVVLDVCRNELDLTVFSWRVKRRDPQVPLRFRFLLETPTGAVLCREDGLDVGVKVIDDPKLPRGVALRARVIAASVDGTLRGEATVDVVLGRSMGR
jgi:predicted secreted hydrolase